jgi:hypothetical protein
VVLLNRWEIYETAENPTPGRCPSRGDAPEYLPIIKGVDWRVSMDFTAISDFISNTGVPVALCIALFFLWYREMNSHKDESKLFTAAINNNTQALNELSLMLKEMKET